MTTVREIEATPLPAAPEPRVSAEASNQLGNRIAWWGILAWALLPIAILALSRILTVGDGRDVLLPVVDVVLPETCAMHSRLGIDCPGCGMTRSFIHIAHGDLVSAWHLHPLSFLVFIYVSSQIPLALLHLKHGQLAWVQSWRRVNEWTLIGLMVAVFGYWLCRLALGDLF